MENPASAPAEQAIEQRSRAWFVGMLVFVILRALPNLSYPIGRDQATYCVIGQGLLHGQQLYRDLWDIKPPAIYYAYALIVKLLGPSMGCVGVVDFLWLLAISYCIFRFAARWVGPPAAVIAVGINAAWHCRSGYVHAAQPETFLILFVFAGFFVLSREDRWSLVRHFAAGLLLGAAFWFKYNALAFLPFLVLVPHLDTAGLDARPLRVSLLIPWRAWLLKGLVLGAGLVTAIVAVLLYFWRAGLWGTLWDSHFKVVARYAISPLEGWNDYWLVPIVGTVYRVGFWTLVATAAAWWLARKRRELFRLGPILLGALVGYVSAVMQVRFQTYAFETCHPFFAIIWGYCIVKAWGYFRAFDGRFAERRSYAARILLWVLVASGIFWLLGAEGSELARRYRSFGAWVSSPEQFFANYPAQYPLEHLTGQMQVINYLQSNAAAGDQVYVWGTAPLIYFLTGRHSPTRFVPNHPLLSPWAPAAWKRELVRDLQNSLPQFIVVARKDQISSVTSTLLDSEQYLSVFPELEALISGSYRPAVAFTDFVVYRRGALP